VINVLLQKIDKAAIEALLANEVREGRTIEYKYKLPGPTNHDRKEFLADVTAFANAAGGDMVFGIADRRENGKPTGIPEAVSGLAGVNFDAEILCLENMLRDGVEPRLGGYHFRPVTGFDSGPVLVLRIPKSFLAPHMVKTGESRFYSRTSNGRYSLDVTEIRSAFALSESLPEKIRRFRDERLARIVAEETPTPLPPFPKTVLHLLPVSALDPTTRIDVSPVESRYSNVQPLATYLKSWGARYNLDGILVPKQA
jgi:hypothetical protein